MSKSIRHSKINIKLNSKDKFYKFSSFLKVAGINIEEYGSLIKNLENRGNKKIRWLLGNNKYSLMKEYIFALWSFGLQNKQIAYFMSNQVSASKVGQYVKENNDYQYGQKHIMTYTVKKNSIDKYIIVYKIDEKIKLSLDELLNQEILLCKFGTHERISLKDVKRRKKTISRIK